MTAPKSSRMALAIFACLVLAAPIRAFAGDGRIASAIFSADSVVRITGRQGVQAAITFGEDESIENVAIGDATAWQVTPNKRANVLFVKPLLARARTNMTVVTDRHMYLFDLVAGTGERPVYVMRLLDPAYKRAGGARPNEATGQPALTEVEANAVAGSVREAATDPASLNFAWTAKGEKGLLPSRVYDDGQATFIAWLPRTPIPAIQVRNEAGVEGPVNFAVRDDVIVVDGVPEVLILRSGRKLALLERGAMARKAAQAPSAPAPVPASAQAAPGTLPAGHAAPLRNVATEN